MTRYIIRIYQFEERMDRVSNIVCSFATLLRFGRRTSRPAGYRFAKG
ncbi:hypothetical protein [Pedobacter suwonensis]